LHTPVLGYADWDRWLNYLETALHTAQQLQDEAVCARLLEQCADVVFQMGDLARAKDCTSGPVKFMNGCMTGIISHVC
jgi:hypothetical protein